MRSSLEQPLLREAADTVMITRRINWFVALIAGAACAGTEPHIKPNDTGAAEHHASASQERTLAQEDAARYDPAAARVNPLPLSREASASAFRPVRRWTPSSSTC